MFEKIYLGTVSVLALGTAFLIAGVFMKYMIQWQEIFILVEYLFGAHGTD